jgi:hypothetical protein
VTGYQTDLIGHIIGNVLGLFFSGWALMIALGILEHPTDYVTSTVLAILIRMTIGDPEQALRLQAIKKKWGKT